MILGHMPGGFLVSWLVLRKHRNQPWYLPALLAGLFASISPDLDLFYHHFIDDRQHGHHSYWTHIPIYWIAIYALLYWPVHRWGSQALQVTLNVMFLALMSHMVLDSITSGIKWLYPFETQYIGMWRYWLVPTRYDWWVLNYLLHWTIIFEFSLIASSLWIIWRDKALQSRVLALLQHLWSKQFAFKRAERD